MQIFYLSGKYKARVITAVAVVSPFSFALLEFTHFQSHREWREGGEFVRGAAWRGEETHGFHPCQVLFALGPQHKVCPIQYCTEAPEKVCSWL